MPGVDFSEPGRQSAVASPCPCDPGHGSEGCGDDTDGDEEEPNDHCCPACFSRGGVADGDDGVGGGEDVVCVGHAEEEDWVVVSRSGIVV